MSSSPASRGLSVSALFGHLSAATALAVTSEDGEILYASPALARLFGDDGLPGQSIFGYVTARDMRELLALLRARPHVPVSIEVRARRPDGHGFWCSLEVLPVGPEVHPRARYLTVMQELSEQRARHEQDRELRRAQMSARQLRQITRQLPSITWTTSLDLRLTGASGAALGTFGLEPSQYLGHGVPEVLRDSPVLEQAVRAHEFALAGQEGHYTHELGDRVFDVQVRPFRDDAGRVVGVLGQAVDVTERRLAQRHFQDRAAVLEAISTNRPLDETLSRITALLERQRSGCLVQILIRRGNLLHLGAAHNLPDGLIDLLTAGVPVGLEYGGCGAVAETGQPQHTASIGDDPLWQPYWEVARRHDLRSCWTVPLRASSGEVLGTLAVYAHTGAPVQPGTLDLLERTASLAAIALERGEHLRAIALSREETLRALGLALEYRDAETGGHTDRVVGLTERLARHLGLEGAALDALRWGAYLHDVGKMAIPDAILLKPGRLTPEEWAVIRRHPQAGHDLLASIPALPRATLEVVLCHHERWDGQGYPQGLRGEAIPVGARLFNVVDVYDALTSERPYKSAWPHEEALAELRRMAGTALDPAMVAAFELLEG